TKRRRACDTGRTPVLSGHPGRIVDPPGRLYQRYADALSSVVETCMKMADSESPRAVRAAIRPTATRAAIRPYSIAVAPDSSFTKVFRVFNIDWVSFLKCPARRMPSSYERTLKAIGESIKPMWFFCG